MAITTYGRWAVGGTVPPSAVTCKLSGQFGCRGSRWVVVPQLMHSVPEQPADRREHTGQRRHECFLHEYSSRNDSPPVSPALCRMPKRCPMMGISITSPSRATMCLPEGCEGES